MSDYVSCWAACGNYDFTANLPLPLPHAYHKVFNIISLHSLPCGQSSICGPSLIGHPIPAAISISAFLFIFIFTSIRVLYPLINRTYSWPPFSSSLPASATLPLSQNDIQFFIQQASLRIHIMKCMFIRFLVSPVNFLHPSQYSHFTRI